MRFRSIELLATAALMLMVGCGSSSSGSADTTDGNEAGGSGGSAGRTGDAGNQIGSGNAGNGGAKQTGSCSFTSPPPAPNDADAGTTTESMVRTQWLGVLDSLVGQYLRGDVLVYRGTAKGNDNTSAISTAAGASPEPDQSIAQGAALARLEYRPSSSSDYSPPLTAPAGDAAILVLHALADGKHVVFSQAHADPTQTDATMIGAANTFVILRTSCSACAPSFWGHPNAIDFDLTTNGMISVFQGIASQGGHDVDVPLQMTASANLVLAPPCSISFDDLAVLDTAIGPNEGSEDFGLQSFHPQGDEMVRHATGSINGGATTGRCFLSTPYSIDLFVKLDDLSNYGVRNYSPGTQQEQCAP